MKKSILKRETITGISLFGFYRIEHASIHYMSSLVAQLLRTFLDNGACVALVEITTTDFKTLAQLYRDIRLRYWSARRDSSFCQVAKSDDLANTLASIFPELDFNLAGKKDC